MRILFPLLLLLAGCATTPFPARPDVSFYHQLEAPLLVPQPPTQRPGKRPLTPPAVEAPICMTEKDHTALSTYFDRLDSWQKKAGK